MRTILNIGLGLALAFCLIFLVSGEFEKYVDRRVEVALAERLGAVGEESIAEEVAEEVKPASKPAKATAKPVDNRVYIDVRGPKGAVKLYVGQPKDEVLELLGTPDSYNFGGTYEDCRYDLSLTSWISLDFKNGKLTKVNKY